MDRKIVALFRLLAVAMVLVLSAQSAAAQTTYFSRSPGGNWNSNTTWSTVAFDDPTNAGTFPIAGDIVFIGGTGSIVTITGAAAACSTLTIDDNSTLNVGNGLTVSGTTTVGSGSSGVLAITSTAGGKLFIGSITINTGGLWNETVNEPIVFRGGITNNGTFTAGTGVHTFNTNSQALTGTFSIPSVTVTAGEVLTNNTALTVSTALSGAGGITQGAGATLNIGGTSAITNMTATAAGNTVNYTGAAQTVHSNAYENLILSGSGVKTLQAGTTAITGDLTISGTADATAVVGLTIGGDVTLSGGTFTAGAFTHNVGGDWTNNGTFTGTGSVINLNGSAQNISGVTTTFNDLQLSGSGTKTFSVSTTISNELSIANGAIADLSNANVYTSNTLILGGALQGSGTWGSTSSAATNQNNTFFSGNGLITVNTGGFTYYSIASTDWSLTSTWSTIGFNGAAASTTPGAGDYVIIGDGENVTVTGTEQCDVLLFDENSVGTLSINSGSLTIGTSLTIPQSTSATNTLSVAGGTLVSPNLAFTAGGGAGHQVSISTGTATISGDITGIGASSTIAFTGSGTLQVGGAMFTSATGTLSAPSGTVEYNGAAQTVQALGYNNLTLSGSGTKTLAATTAVGGNLTIGDVTFTIGGFTFSVGGTTTIGGGTSGTLSFTATAGTKTFTGLVTINTGGTWNEAVNEAIIFQGGITNNGTFTAGTGAHTFNTNSQALTGTFSIPSVTVTAGEVLTNNTALTVSTALSGAGGITQGAGATLNIGGTSAITNMTATAAGNTVNYTGAAQTVHSNAYENLTLSGSGIKTLQVGTTAITGNFELGGSASTTAVTGLTIGGDVTLGNGTSLTAGAFTHTVAGDWINNGTTFTATGSVINFNGTAQNIGGSSSTTFNDVLLSGTGTKTFAVSTTISNELSIASGAIANLSNTNTYTSNTLILAGALQGAGTWGSTASSPAAANQNDTFFSGTGLISVATGGSTFYSIASTDWSLASTWSTTGFFGGPASNAPGAGDYVIIGNGQSVTVTGTEQCEELLFDAGTSITNTLTINSGGLTVNADIIIPQTVTSGSNTLTVTAGSLSAANLDFTASGSGAGHQLSIGAGTVTISGDITGSGVSSTIAFTGSGVLQVGGAMFTAATGTLSAPSGTVEYNGSAQTVQALPYRNLTLSGSGNKTLAATTTISGNLVVGDNTSFVVGAVTLVVTGSTTVGGGTSGVLSFTSTTGTKTFTGLVTIAPNGTWSNTANEPITFQGGITNNGTFTAGTGAQLFNAAQSLSGILSIPTMNVAGAGAFAVTNNGTLTVSTSLLGSDQLAQGIGAILNLGGLSTITILNATASGNTVNFSGGAQTVNSTNYFNLTLSGSGVKTLQAGTTLIAGSLTLTGTASTTAAASLTIGGDLDIGSGTSFTSGAFDHVIGGNWINDGTFNHSNRRITFSGTTTQSIQGTSATTFFDLHIAEGPDPLDVQLDQTAGVNLVGEMTFDDDAVFDADGPVGDQIFTVISTVSGDGRIGPLGGTADVTGNVTVQRYMDAEGKIYRYISAPVDNPTAEDLQGEIPITGPFTGSSFTAPDVNCPSCVPCTGCVLDNTSMYRYDETIVAALNNRYTPFPGVGGTNSETMIPGRGYAVYIRNDVSATTWNLRAPINTGEVNLNPTITGSNDGFNLVGNPYPSPIDWESGAWTRNGGIDPTIYTWDNSISNYASYTIGGASNNGGSRYIAHGQAFWVLASSGADLRAQEGIKASQASINQATFFRTAKADQVRVKLVADNSSDELLIKVNHQGATAGYDARIDALEFPSDTLLSLHSITPDKKWLAVNQLGIQTENGSEINVGLAGTKPGSYKLDFIEFENFATPTSVYLFDRYDDVLQEILPSEKEYQFTVTEDPVSAGDRFVVFITPAGKQPMLEKFEATMVSVYPNPTTEKISVRVKSSEPASATIYSSIGVPVVEASELVKSGNQRIGQFDLSSLPAGVYIMQIQSGKNLFNKRIMKQ